jgi:hypothetical protein
MELRPAEIPQCLKTIPSGTEGEGNSIKATKTLRCLPISHDSASFISFAEESTDMTSYSFSSTQYSVSPDCGLGFEIPPGAVVYSPLRSKSICTG